MDIYCSITVLKRNVLLNNMIVKYLVGILSKICQRKTIFFFGQIDMFVFCIWMDVLFVEAYNKIMLFAMAIN